MAQFIELKLVDPLQYGMRMQGPLVLKHPVNNAGNNQLVITQKRDDQKIAVLIQNNTEVADTSDVTTQDITTEVMPEAGTLIRFKFQTTKTPTSFLAFYETQSAVKALINVLSLVPGSVSLDNEGIIPALGDVGSNRGVFIGSPSNLSNVVFLQDTHATSQISFLAPHRYNNSKERIFSRKIFFATGQRVFLLPRHEFDLSSFEARGAISDMVARKIVRARAIDTDVALYKELIADDLVLVRPDNDPTNGPIDWADHTGWANNI